MQQVLLLEYQPHVGHQLIPITLIIWLSPLSAFHQTTPPPSEQLKSNNSRCAMNPLLHSRTLEQQQSSREHVTHLIHIDIIRLLRQQGWESSRK